MKKVAVAILLVAVMVTALVACEDKPETVEILPAQTVTVNNAAELADMRNYTGEKYKNYTFELAADIDLSEYKNWTPIGTAEQPFYGTFDGKGKTVTGLTYEGWDANGYPYNPASAQEGVSEATFHSAMGLFGAVNSATVKNFTLGGVSLKYYADNGFSYIGSVVGYAVGNTKVSDVTVGGNVYISNIYEKNKTYDNKGEFQNMKDECEGTLYVGGVVGYSVGAAEFKNIVSTVNIDNNYYHAYYQTKDTVEPDMLPESGEVENKYVVESGTSYTNVLLKQVFVGGIAGVIKNGSVSGGSYSGTLNVYAKSTDAAGIVAAVYNGAVDTVTVTNVNLNASATAKNILGGTVALLSSTDLTDAEAVGVTIYAGKIGTSIQSIVAGGVFGYASDLSLIDETVATDLKLTSLFMEADAGGIGGVIRDSVVSNGTATGTEFRINESNVKEESFASYGYCLGAVYGNSEVKGCSGSATNYNTGTANVKKCAEVSSTVYVNEDGMPAVRLFAEGSTSQYVIVDAKAENGLTIDVYSEEYTLLFSLSYEGSFTASSNTAETYLDTYFEQGKGFKDGSGYKASEGDRNFAKYEYRSGVPVID